MINLAETMYCCSIACSAEGKPTEAGSYYVDTLLANTVKLNCTRNMYEISRLAHDIAGGFIATLPYEADYKSPVTGPYIDKYFKGKADIPTENRIRMARLIENMTGGTALAESMHGAGSPQAMRIMLYRESNLQEKSQYAKNLAGIKSPDVEEQVAVTKEDKE
jgi:4-hydroxybutyryl-CoA dehydratase/vinylacetyl-CoA-Delta-isomerase